MGDVTIHVGSDGLDDTPAGLPAMSDGQEGVWRRTNKAAFDALRAQRLLLLAALHAEGWTHAQLGKLYSCSKQRIQHLLRDAAPAPPVTEP